MLKQEFHIKPSKRYLVLLSLVFITSILIVLSLVMSMVMKIALLCIVVGYGGWIVHRFGLLRAKKSIIGLRYASDGTWYLRTPQSLVLGELCGDSTITGSVAVLRFKVPGEYWTQTCILFPDSILAPNHYQQLIMMLRMY